MKKDRVDPQSHIDKLYGEIERLKSEVEWRKGEAKTLRRSIGSGRVYSKLRGSLRDAEKTNEVLKGRIRELEAEMKTSWSGYFSNDAFFNRLIRKVIETGDALQHAKWTECRCSICREWQQARDDLSYHFGFSFERFERPANLPAMSKVKVV